jgi:hypothetical protein
MQFFSFSCYSLLLCQNIPVSACSLIPVQNRKGELILLRTEAYIFTTDSVYMPQHIQDLDIWHEDDIEKENAKYRPPPQKKLLTDSSLKLSPAYRNVAMLVRGAIPPLPNTA